MIARLGKLIALVTAAGILAALWIVVDGSRPYLGSKTAIELDLLPGTSSTHIAEQLENARVIRHKETFLALHMMRRRQTLKASTASIIRRRLATFCANSCSEKSRART